LHHRYRVLAINLFGYGKTSCWSGTRPLSAADQAGLVAAAVASVPGPIALVGHSLGGAVALEAAVKLADRVRVVIAFEPILFGHLKVYEPASAYDEIAGVANRYNELARNGDWNTAGEWFVDYWTAPGTWAATPDERKQGMLAMLPAVVHEWDVVVNGTRPLKGWSAIAAPVHLIHAADTRSPTRAIVKLLANNYPKWAVHEVPTGAHLAPVSQSNIVNPLIAAAIDAQLMAQGSAV
jgi:pimeloyl-ACP methyl ester carboxylesterase